MLEEERGRPDQKLRDRLGKQDRECVYKDTHGCFAQTQLIPLQPTRLTSAPEQKDIPFSLLDGIYLQIFNAHAPDPLTKARKKKKIMLLRFAASFSKCEPFLPSTNH